MPNTESLVTAGSPGSRGWRRFHRNRPAAFSAAFLLAASVGLCLALPFSGSWFDVQGLEQAVRHPPSYLPSGEYTRFADQLQMSRMGRPLAWAGPAAYRAAGWMGYDALGRSLFYRCLLGWLVSLGVGLAAAATAVVLGTAWGCVAAYVGGRTDAVMMRIVDVLYGLPYVLLVILLGIGLERPVQNLLGAQSRWSHVLILFVAIGSVSWLTMARVVRGQVLSLRSQAFVEAARAAGIRPLRILWRHILPNLVGPVAVYATLLVPQAILQESFLSFLGLGVRAPIPSLGRLAAEGVQAVNTFVSFWWMITFPCVILVATLLALNFWGDGLRDAFDPKSSAASLV